MRIAITDPTRELSALIAQRGHTRAIDDTAEITFAELATPTEVAAHRRAAPRAVLIAIAPPGADAVALLDAGADDVVRGPLALPDFAARLRVAEGLARGRRELGAPREPRDAQPLGAALEALGVGIAIVRRDGTVRDLSPMIAAAVGRPAAALLDLPLEALATAEPGLSIAVVGQHALEDGAVLRHEAQDEAGRVWEVIGSGIGATDTDGEVVVTVRDLTDALRMRQLAAQHERMAQVGAVVAGVAHEVRNPLFGISGIVDALDARVSDRPELQGHLAMLRAAVGRMTRLMNDLLQLGSPGVFERDAVGLGGVIDEARGACEATAAQHGVALEASAAARGAVVTGDRSRLVQVLQNVIDNALRHAPRGSTVAVDAGPSACGRLVRVVVRDRGPGFGADHERAFEPFFSRRRGGTGLGLAIVRRIVEAHGGTVVAGDHADGGGEITLVLATGAGASA